VHGQSNYVNNLRKCGEMKELTSDGKGGWCRHSVGFGALSDLSWRRADLRLSAR
jgi:hypothetical protein